MSASMAAAEAAGARAIVGWEAPPGARPDDWFAAFDAIASRVGRVAAGVSVPLDPALAAAADRIAALARRHDVAVLPVARLDHADAGDGWRRTQLPAAIAALRAAGVLCRRDGVRHAVVATPANGTGLDALPALAAALCGPDATAQLGWRRTASRFLPTPAGFDFAVEWPPYDGGEAGTAQGPRACSYPMLVGDLAKRRAGDGLLAPGVLWSATRDADVLDGQARLTDFTPLRFAHALDGAARYVHNRGRECVPYWWLRTAFAPADPAHLAALERLAADLAAPHRPSPAVGGVAGPIAAPALRARVAVVVHLYYPDLWAELADAIAKLPEAFDLYVSCPFRLLPAVRRQVVARFPGATVFGVQNLGRDVLPFLLWLRAVGADAYTYVLKLHGKKSVHIIDAEQMPFGGGDAWRRDALGGLVGTGDHARRLLAALDAAPATGLVAPAGQLYDQVTWRCATTDLVRTLLARLGIDREVQGGFPAGTMFWARMSALARLAALPDALIDFEREAGQVDGTLHHAWERALALVAEHDGYAVTDSARLAG